jgi:hypothetical protein
MSGRGRHASAPASGTLRVSALALGWPTRTCSRSSNDTLTKRTGALAWTDEDLVMPYLCARFRSAWPWVSLTANVGKIGHVVIAGHSQVARPPSGARQSSVPRFSKMQIVRSMLTRAERAGKCPWNLGPKSPLSEPKRCPLCVDRCAGPVVCPHPSFFCQKRRDNSAPSRGFSLLLPFICVKRAATAEG